MQNYLDPTSEAKITRVVETELIGKQVGTGSAEKAALRAAAGVCMVRPSQWAASDREQSVLAPLLVPVSQQLPCRLHRRLPSLC